MEAVQGHAGAPWESMATCRPTAPGMQLQRSEPQRWNRCCQLLLRSIGAALAAPVRVLSLWGRCHGVGSQGQTAANTWHTELNMEAKNKNRTWEILVILVMLLASAVASGPWWAFLCSALAERYRRWSVIPLGGISKEHVTGREFDLWNPCAWSFHPVDG